MREARAVQCDAHARREDGIDETAGIANHQEAVASQLLHRIAVSPSSLKGRIRFALRNVSSIIGRVPTELQKNFSRSSLDLAKFFFCVTTPMLVTSSEIGICQIQVFEIGRK